MKTKFRLFIMAVGFLIASIDPATDKADTWLLWTIVLKAIGIGMCYFGATYKNKEKYETEQA